MTTLEPMAAHDGPGYQPVVATYTDDNTITMRRQTRIDQSTETNCEIETSCEEINVTIIEAQID